MIKIVGGITNFWEDFRYAGKLNQGISSAQL